MVVQLSKYELFEQKLACAKATAREYQMKTSAAMKEPKMTDIEELILTCQEFQFDIFHMWIYLFITAHQWAKEYIFFNMYLKGDAGSIE